jgi:acyl-CoA carboxylase subunit beta
VRQSAEKSKIKVNENELNKRKSMFSGMVKQQSSVYYTSSRMIDDSIIDPRDTRDILGMSLSVCYSGEVKGNPFSGFFFFYF